MSVLIPSEKDIELPSAQVHLLQNLKFTNYDGPAPVSQYFHTCPSEKHTSKDLTLMESAFRGRTLIGSEIELPEGFHGTILEKTLTKQDSEMEVEEEVDNLTETLSSTWNVVGMFHKFCYWNHEILPHRSDTIHRALEWPALASALHKPIDPIEVEAILKQEGGA